MGALEKILLIVILCVLFYFYSPKFVAWLGRKYRNSH